MAARLRATRDAIGPDIELMLDANNAWADLPTALQYVRRFEPMAPYWIEEPFLPDDIENHAALARATPIPVATGEIEVGRWRFRELLEKRAAAIPRTDATVCGGVTEWRRLTATASSYGVATSPHPGPCPTNPGATRHPSPAGRGYTRAAQTCTAARNPGWTTPSPSSLLAVVPAPAP